ncbi:MAG: PKD domain-containing protein [Bacteroidia bacterium]
MVPKHNNKFVTPKITGSTRLLIICCFLSATLFSDLLFAQPLPNFSVQLFKTGWNEVEGIRFDATGQAYVWEKAGKVWVIDTNGVKISLPLLDISEEVGNWRDHGLNGFILDPNFRINGYFYLFYTVDRHYLMNYGTGNYNAAVNEYFNATIVRLTRYTANSATNFSTIIPNSRLILIGENKKTGVSVLHESHSGSQLVFGTDGSLLISTGDGASYNSVDSGGGLTYWQQAITDTIIRDKENVGAYRSQLIDCLNGKILRIDPATGNGLSSNPYYDAAQPRSAKSRVWDLGLRNPFRMTIRPGTGSTDISAGDPGVLFIGDVGWDAWEEIDVATGPGLNFGWPRFEGLTPSFGYVNITSPFNKDAPNPLYGGGCTNQFFRFNDLLIQASLAPSFPNPCNASQQIPANIPHFVHTRPASDWDHNVDLTRTGTYTGNNASEISVSNALSPVKGYDFKGNASVGGAWYTGTKYPQEFQNTYFHGDYVYNWIINFKFGSGNALDSIKYFAYGLGPVVDVEYNPKDEWLYYISYPSDIYKIVYTTSVNNPPVAVASQNVIYGSKPLLVNFTGINSTDPENLPLSYSWNFGDGTPISNAPNPMHTFNPLTNSPVAFTVTLTVTDNIGQTSIKTLNVYVNDTPPQVTITSFTNGDLFTMSHNTIQSLQANVLDAESPDHLLSYEWQTFLHHNSHEHPEAGDTNRITTTVLTPVDCDGTSTYYYRIELTVTDPIGLSTMVQGNIYPACNAPVPDFSGNVTAVCPGMQVNFTDASSNLPDTWLWSFPGGNPSTSSLQNPSVIYASTGTYSVSLTVASTRGSNSVTKTGYIKVNPNPAAAITPAGTDTVCAYQLVMLTANSGNNLSYQWIKGGVNIAGATAQTFSAVNAGNYKLKVTNTVSGCNRTSPNKLIVYRVVKSTASAQGSTTFCNGDSVKIKANSGPYSYQWRKDGIPVSGATSINYIAKATGAYKVKVTDAYGCTRVSPPVIVTVNCKEIESKIESKFAVAINPNPVHGEATLKISMPERDNVTIQIFNALGGLVTSFDKNIFLNEGANEMSLNVSSFAAGIYFVKVSDSFDSKTLKLIVNTGN